MCIIFFIVSDSVSESGYKLILASNRDEMYARPAKAACTWEDADHVIAGRDMESGREGGTWLGISAKEDRIKIGALLNLPGEKQCENPAGRGPIVTNYLKGTTNNVDYSEGLFKSKVDYNSFNFVSLEFDTTTNHCQILNTSNCPNEIKEFPANKVLGFSNSTWRSPLQKVTHGCSKFEEIIQRTESQEELVSNLLNLLSDDTKFGEDPELKRRIGHYPGYAQYSSVYVHVPTIKYGSRARTVILIDNDNNIDFYEESLNGDGSWDKVHIRKQLG